MVPMDNYDALQQGGALERKLNHENPHWPKSVTGSGVAYELCLCYSREKVIAYIQTIILCNINLCVKHFGNFHTIRTLFEDKQTITSSEKDRPSKGKT